MNQGQSLGGNGEPSEAPSSVDVWPTATVESPSATGSAGWQVVSPSVSQPAPSLPVVSATSVAVPEDNDLEEDTMELLAGVAEVIESLQRLHLSTC